MCEKVGNKKPMKKQPFFFRTVWYGSAGVDYDVEEQKNKTRLFRRRRRRGREEEEKREKTKKKKEEKKKEWRRRR